MKSENRSIVHKMEGIIVILSEECRTTIIQKERVQYFIRRKYQNYPSEVQSGVHYLLQKAKF
jgi:hypothetical protein